MLVEKFKYLRVSFTSDGKLSIEIDERIERKSKVSCELVTKEELSRKAKLSVLKSVYVATLAYSHEPWVVIESLRSRVQAVEMRFTQKNRGTVPTRSDQKRGNPGVATSPDREIATSVVRVYPQDVEKEAPETSSLC
jgi:hypothetical protein